MQVFLLTIIGNYLMATSRRVVMSGAHLIYSVNDQWTEERERVIEEQLERQFTK